MTNNELAYRILLKLSMNRVEVRSHHQYLVEEVLREHRFEDPNSDYFHADRVKEAYEDGMGDTTYDFDIENYR